MEKYTAVRETQIHLLTTVDFYSLSTQEEFNLYKKAGDRLGQKKSRGKNLPELYILEKDKKRALKELGDILNTDLAKGIAAGGLVQTKKAVSRIVQEALVPDQEEVREILPKTIELLIQGFDKNHTSISQLTRTVTHSSLVAEHTVNVTALVLQHCFFHGIRDEECIRLALCALLHDIGTSEIDPSILESKERLNDKQYKIFQNHTLKGHDILSRDKAIDESVATVALDHHELIDGSGYPSAKSEVSADSQLIGLINCYEPLTYLNKNFRRAQKPFDSLKHLKQETIRGKFSKEIFKQFTSCLTK